MYNDHQRAEDPGKRLETATAGGCTYLPQQIPVHIFPPQQATLFLFFVYVLRVRARMRLFQRGNRRRSCCLSALGRKTTAAFSSALFHQHDFVTTTLQRARPRQPAKVNQASAGNLKHIARLWNSPPRVHEADPSSSSLHLPGR